MRKTTLITVLTLFISINLTAQSADDTQAYSQTFYEGTGRSMSMGNATGAMGGDVTAICINPAGLGLYRSSEITFTTGLQHTLTTNRYYDERHSKGYTNMTIPNFGYVLALECSNYKPLRFLQLSVGLTRTNDFNFRSNAKGTNPTSSFIDSYLQTINDIDVLFHPSTDPGNYFSDHYPYTLNPAWQTYLINQFQDSLGFFYDSPIPQGNVNQNDRWESKGRAEEWTVATSANLYDKLFLGLSVGLTHIKRSGTRTYTETPASNSSPITFTQWSFQEQLEDTAWGINAKVGVIYSLKPRIRLGVAWHTPTYYSIGEGWCTTTSSTLINDHQEEQYQYYSPTSNDTYDFTTPHVFTGSAAFVFGQRGMITTDIDYRKPSINLRVGTEWMVRQFFVRGGMAYYGSPYGLGNSYGSMKKLALGIGYAFDDGMYWDLAYELSEQTTAYTPYQYYVDEVNAVENAIQHLWRNKVVATLKIKM